MRTVTSCFVERGTAAPCPWALVFPNSLTNHSMWSLVEVCGCGGYLQNYCTENSPWKGDADFFSCLVDQDFLFWEQTLE